jgi:Flp pilus assembly protein TadG
MWGKFRTKLASVALPRVRLRVVRRLARNDQGSAAVEFGFVAAPFFLLLCGILETALVFFAGQTLETAVADSARLIMTGQAQAQGFDQAKFKSEVCKRVFSLFSCDGGIKVNVQTFPSFQAVSLPKPIDPQTGKFTDQNFKYQHGGPGDIVAVQIFYEWKVFLSLYGFNLADLPDRKRLLAATVAFRNEPFQ